MITQEYLRECLNYNPETGAFVWVSRPPHHFRRAKDVKIWEARCSGRPVGARGPDGYIHTSICNKSYRLHRLAFLYMTGSIPDVVDHINGARGDNRWENLRAASVSENQRNSFMQSSNKSGINGVYFRKKEQKWTAQIRVGGGKRASLGCFDTKEQAAEARRIANEKYGYSNRHGAARPSDHA